MALRSAVFGGRVNLSWVVFREGLDLHSAAFASPARFISAEFRGPAGFESVRFGTVVDFASARFAGAADFESADFRGDADFEGAEFADRADFRGTRFLELAASYDLILDSPSLTVAERKENQEKTHEKIQRVPSEPIKIVAGRRHALGDVDQDEIEEARCDQAWNG